VVLGRIDGLYENAEQVSSNLKALRLAQEDDYTHVVATSNIGSGFFRQGVVLSQLQQQEVQVEGLRRKIDKLIRFLARQELHYNPDVARL